MSGDREASSEENGKTVSRERRIGKFTLISLALNIFFVGAAGALAVRHYLGEEHHGGRTPGEHIPAKRIEALAAQLPPDDAAILRAEFALRAAAAEAARETLRRSRDEVRRALQAEPYDAAAARTAMAASRVAHAAFIEVLQDVVASAAGRMSPAGRVRLGEASSRERRRSKKAD